MLVITFDRKMAPGHIVWRKQRTFNQETQKYEEEWMPQGASFLRTGISLAGRSAGIAAIR